MRPSEVQRHVRNALPGLTQHLSVKAAATNVRLALLRVCRASPVARNASWDIIPQVQGQRIV